MTKIGALVSRFAYLSAVFYATIAQAVMAPDPSFKDLTTLIDQQNITRIEDLLSALPLSYRNSFTLVYDSKSVQGASRQYPRAIVFGREARTVITFNGHASQRDLTISRFYTGTSKGAIGSCARSPSKQEQSRKFLQAIRVVV